MWKHEGRKPCLEDREVFVMGNPYPRCVGMGMAVRRARKPAWRVVSRRRTRGARGVWRCQGRGSHNEAMRGGIWAHGRRGRAGRYSVPVPVFLGRHRLRPDCGSVASTCREWVEGRNGWSEAGGGVALKTRWVTV